MDIIEEYKTEEYANLIKVIYDNLNGIKTIEQFFSLLFPPTNDGRVFGETNNPNSCFTLEQIQQSMPFGTWFRGIDANREFSEGTTSMLRKNFIDYAEERVKDLDRTRTYDIFSAFIKTEAIELGIISSQTL